MKRFFPYLAVVIAMLCWSISGIAIKQALLVLPPFTMIVMRFTLAVLLMLLIGLFFRKNKMLRLQVLNRKDIPLFFLAGVFQPFLYYLLETFSYDALGSPTIAEALLSTSPLLSPLFAAVRMHGTSPAHREPGFPHRRFYRHWWYSHQRGDSRIWGTYPLWPANEWMHRSETRTG